jgi:uncharacterized protein (TIGR00730 family)
MKKLSRKKPLLRVERHYQTGNKDLDQKISEVVDMIDPGENADLLRDIIVTAAKLHDDGMERGDIRMLTTALKELRYALKVFQPYQHVRKVAIFGSARTSKSDPDYKLALEFSRRVVDSGWMVVTGAASGIMQAGNEGAGRAHSFGVNIRLPFEQEANPYILDDAKLINFKYFFTRKLIFIRESDATVLCPGGFGTHDEGFETLTLVQTGKAVPRPIVCMDNPKSKYWQGWREFLKKQLADRGMIDPDDLGMIHFTHDPADAVRVITHFYRNYHSSRYIGDMLVIRIKQALSKAKVRDLNSEFKMILAKGKIEQRMNGFPEEENERHTFDLPRIALYFNRRHFAKMIQLINRINEE